MDLTILAVIVAVAVAVLIAGVTKMVRARGEGAFSVGITMVIVSGVSLALLVFLAYAL